MSHESPNFEEFEPPVGIGGEKLKEERETLPMVDVKNSVEWVDSNVEMPFNIAVGQKVDFPLFLSSNPQKKERTYPLEVEEDHGRSGILARVVFKDNEGRMYRDVDLKGMGYVSYPEDGEGPIVDKVSITSRIRGRAEGIQPLGRALHDLRRTQLFIDLGVRTQRILALIKLKEIVDDKGNKLSVSQARQRKLINAGEEDVPVVTMRAFGVRSRMSEIANQEEEKAGLKLEDARLFVAQENGLNTEGFGYDEYSKWMAKTIAVDVARIHGNGWVHGFLTDHNITLDGRIIDLDSVVKIKEAEGTPRTVGHDLDDTRRYLTQFFGDINKLKSDDKPDINEGEMMSLFESEYKNELSKIVESKRNKK